MPIALFGSILIAAGVSTANPVIVKQGRLLDRNDIVKGILRVSRNPFFWGSGLLSLALLTALGDLASLFAFGSIALLGIVGSLVLDAKKAREFGAAWNAFAAATSNVPFLAIVSRRQHFSMQEIGPQRLASGLGVFLVTLAFGAVHFGTVPFVPH